MTKTFPGTQLLVAFLLVLLLVPSSLHAQAATPALFGVQEIVVQPPRFDDAKASAGCSLNRNALAAAIDKQLQLEHVPVTPAARALPPRMDVARIELIPAVTTLNNDGLDCTSWVSLTAQFAHTIVIPPVSAPRNLMVVYWRQGTLAASPQSSHATVVGDMLEKMATAFAAQYIADQKK